MELLALCGVCLLERRKVNNPPHKASALTYDAVCQDCGRRADYFVAHCCHCGERIESAYAEE